MNFCFIRRARDKVVLHVQRPVYGNGRGRQRPTGSSITAVRDNARPAPQCMMTSSCRFRLTEWPTPTSRPPVYSDARMRRGVLSQLPVSMPEAVTSRTMWNKPTCHVTGPRLPSTRPNIVTTDYGWIDSGDADRDDESDKENQFVDAEELESDDRDFETGDQRLSQGCGESLEVEVVSPWKSPDSSCSMDVDDEDNYVDMKPYSSLRRVPSAGRLTQLPRCAEGPSAMPYIRRHRLPLGTIVETTEPSMTRSTSHTAESSSFSSGSPVDEPDEVDAVRPEPEVATEENFFEPVSRSSFNMSTTDNVDDDVRSQRMDPDPDEVIQTDNITDVSVRQRCAGWRFSSSRPRLTVAEFCRRRRDTGTKKRQRSASVNDDSMSVNDSVTSVGPSTKRRRTALKVP